MAAQHAQSGGMVTSRPKVAAGGAFCASQPEPVAVPQYEMEKADLGRRVGGRCGFVRARSANHCLSAITPRRMHSNTRSTKGTREDGVGR